jgi:hypothetical protein
MLSTISYGTLRGRRGMITSIREWQGLQNLRPEHNFVTNWWHRGESRIIFSVYGRCRRSSPFLGPQEVAVLLAGSSRSTSDLALGYLSANLLTFFFYWVQSSMASSMAPLQEKQCAYLIL